MIWKYKHLIVHVRALENGSLLFTPYTSEGGGTLPAMPGPVALIMRCCGQPGHAASCFPARNRRWSALSVL